MPLVKLAVTSDLHLPITPSTAIAGVAREIDALGADALVVAGDVAESLKDLERCLAILRGLTSCPVWVLAGNHDLWNRDAGSRSKWERLLPEGVAQAGCRWLEGNAFTMGDVAVAGTIGWYDYSAADPSIKASADVFAREKRHFNMDAYLIDWPWTDPEFAALVAGPFLATLDRLEADPAVRQTVVVTHVPLLECQMCRRPDDHDWGFSNAYFGNLTLGAQVLARKKVTHIISGHTHVGREGTVQCEDGRLVQARVLPSDYHHPAYWDVLLETAT
jgi:3',5'-cyclic AMP phosphodiesterase CpdA